MANRISLKLPKGSAWFAVSEGVVAHDNKWSETHPSASDGSAKVVTSRKSKQTEFWIQEDDGTETSVRLSDVDFPVRPGQRVRVVLGASAKRNQGGYLYAHNFASRESVFLVPHWYDWARKQDLTSPPLLYRLLTTWLSLACALLMGMICSALFVGNNYASKASAAATQPVVQDINDLRNRVENSNNPAAALHAPSLLRLGADTLTFATSGLASATSPDSSASENLHLQAVILGFGIGLALWLPLALVFYIVGTLVFHWWWRAAQHRILARKIQPLFVV